MIDGPERGGGQPPLAAAPLIGAPPSGAGASRHQHFPGADRARCRAMQAAAAALDARLRTEDAADGGIIAAMRALAGADADTIFTALSPWLTDHRWVQRRLAAALELCAAEPFAMPPLRMFGGEAFGGLILAEVPPITLSLMIRPFNQPAPPAASIIFLPGHGLTHFVRSGGARIQRYGVALNEAERGGGFRASAAAPMTLIDQAPLADGASIRVDQQCESINIIGGDGDLVML